LSIWGREGWRLGLSSLAIYLTLSVPAAGHEGLHEQIAALTTWIEQDPTNAELYLQRGNLHRLHRNFGLALTDYDRAAQLQTSLAAVDLFRGLTFLDAGAPHLAKLALDRFLATQPDHAEARVARARALMRLGSHLAAAADLTHAINQSPKPKPEYYLERARALAAHGEERIDEALHGLDEGMKTLGPIITLQLYAIELELQKKRPEAALARLGQITAQAARKESWLARRGEILEQAGRHADAREAYAAALAAMETLPASRRKTKMMSELDRRLHAGLERLRAPEGNAAASERQGEPRP